MKTITRSVFIRRSYSLFAARAAGCTTLLTALVMTPALLRADSVTWNGSAGSDFLSPANWSGSAAPGAGDTAVFSGSPSGVNQPVLNADASVGGILYATWNQGWSFTGAAYTLTIGAGGINAAALTGGGTNTVSVGNIVLAENQTWTAGGNGTLRVNSNISGAGKSLRIASLGAGTGSVTLTGTNTFDGGLFIDSGVATILKTESLGAGDITIGDAAATGRNATLRFSGSGAFSAAQNNIHVVGSGTNMIEVTAWSPVLSGDITLDSDLTIAINTNSANTITLNGAVAGTGGLVLESNGRNASQRVILGSQSNDFASLTVKSAWADVRYSSGLGRGAITLGDAANVGESANPDARATLNIAGAENVSTANAVQVYGKGKNTLSVSSWGATYRGGINLNNSDLTLHVANNSGNSYLTVSDEAITGTGDLVASVSSSANRIGRINLTSLVNHSGKLIVEATTDSLHPESGTYVSGTIGSNVTDIYLRGTGNAAPLLVLTGTGNSFTGDVYIEKGILRLGSGADTTADFLTATANVFLSDEAIVDLAFASGSVSESIAALYINGTKMASGTWGAVGSGADFESALITGTGMLEVIPEPAAIAWATGLAALGAVVVCRRRFSSRR